MVEVSRMEAERNHFLKKVPDPFSPWITALTQFDLPPEGRVTRP